MALIKLLYGSGCSDATKSENINERINHRKQEEELQTKAIEKGERDEVQTRL
jgi:hypothetical protein